MIFWLICGLFFAAAAGLIAALWWHKRSASQRIDLSGVGVVTTSLAPEGTVLLHGELWRARSLTQSVVPTSSHVRVIGVAQHLLLVEPI